MKHLLASKSGECCSVDNTARLCLCHAARSCPGSGGFSGPLDTSCEVVSTQPGIPDASCEDEHNPKASFGARRKRLANVEPRAFVCKLQAAVWDVGCGTKSGLIEVESPEGQTRRKKWSDHCWPVGLHSVELLFF